MTPKPPWQPASRRDRALLLGGLAAAGMLLGFLAVWQGVTAGHEREQVANRARSAPATVIAFDDSSPRRAVLRYRTDAGESTMTISYGANLLAVDDRIWVLYDPLDPSDAWAPPDGSPHNDLRDDAIIWLAIGAMACLGAALALVVSWGRGRPPAAGAAPAARSTTTTPP